MNAHWSRIAILLPLLVLALTLGAPVSVSAVWEKPGPGGTATAPLPPTTSSEQSTLRTLTVEPARPFADASRKNAPLLPLGAGAPSPSLRGVLAPSTLFDDARASAVPALRPR